MPALAEPVETVETNAPFRPIAHIGRRENRRRGLCGAEILGIRAFGEFDLCPACRKLNGGDPRDIARQRREWQSYYDL